MSVDEDIEIRQGYQALAKMFVAFPMAIRNVCIMKAGEQLAYDANSPEGRRDPRTSVHLGLVESSAQTRSDDLSCRWADLALALLH